MAETKTVWITGASSGIGEALAYQYAPDRPVLLLSARREDELNRVAEKCRASGATVYVYPFDLGDSTSVRLAWETVKNAGHRIDLLINNGGISQRALAVETPLELDRKLFEINYFGTVQLTKYVLKDMLQNGRGHLAVVSSISGKFGFPLRSGYSATKHALEGFFESVHLENKKNGIDVTIIAPGRIRTGISKSAITASGRPAETMDPGLSNGMPAERCAVKIKRALDRRKREVLVGRKEVLMVWFKRFIPSLFFKLARKVNPV